MAQQKRTPVAPNFKDVDKEATARAQAAVAGGQVNPLKVPKDARTSTDKNGTQYSRWSERMTVVQAYRSVTKTGLIDVAIAAKVRQSKTNDSGKVFAHHYLNMSSELPDGHDEMNDRSYGALITLLTATKLMPPGGVLKGSLLDKMFPQKNQPGTASPLNGKAVIGNIVQQYGPKKDPKTNKPVVDAEGEPILQKRDNIESFLPDAPAKDSEGD